jgi:hypothetical protein
MLYDSFTLFLMACYFNPGVISPDTAVAVSDSINLSHPILLAWLELAVAC